MGGIYYGLSMAAVYCVIYWFIKNDPVPMDKRTSGFLTMKLTEDVLVRKKGGRGPISVTNLR